MRIDPSDLLELGDGRAVAVADLDGALAAVPVISDADGWRRATAGDGVAEALIALLASMPGRNRLGRFTLTSWTTTRPRGEVPVTVDQTNESVIVGDRAVVKWATHLEPGPHPAPRRLEVLRAAGFTSMPEPWGLVTWAADGGEPTLAVTVAAFLPGAVDGWTWAVDLVAAATVDGDEGPVVSASAVVGGVVADLHAALASTARTATAQDARRWHDSALATLADARRAAAPANARLLDARADDVRALLDRLGEAAGTSVIEAHGDLHVGQVLRAGDRFAVTDFDGNPVLAPDERVAAVPAALDVAGMVQSLAHVAIVAAKHHDLAPAALRRVDRASRLAFLDAYRTRLTAAGHTDLFVPDLLPAFRLQQVLREIVYADRHLPRWMYVPDVALPELLEGTAP